MSQNEGSSFLLTKVVSDLLPKVGDDHKGPTSMIQVLPDDTIRTVLTTLTQNRILAAPIFDSKTNTYVGIIDVLDAVTVVAVLAFSKKVLDVFTDRYTKWPEFLEHAHEVFGDCTALEAANASERDPWVQVFMSTPVSSLADMFGKYVNLHRVGVVNEKGECTGMVSQSRLVRFIAQNLDKFDSDRTELPVMKWFKQEQEVQKVEANSKVLDAFNIMIEWKVSAVAVVDEAGVLIGCLSASDLKYVPADCIFSDLYLSVSSFLEKNIHKGKKARMLVVDNKTTNAQALEMLSSSGVHRLFVINSGGAPVGVISLTNMIDFMSSP